MPPRPVPESCGPHSHGPQAARTAPVLPLVATPYLSGRAPAATAALPAGFHVPVPAASATLLAGNQTKPTRPLRRVPGSRQHGHPVSAPVLHTQPGVPSHTRAASRGDPGAVHPPHVQAGAAGFY